MVLQEAGAQVQSWGKIDLSKERALHEKERQPAAGSPQIIRPCSVLKFLFLFYLFVKRLPSSRPPVALRAVRSARV